MQQEVIAGQDGRPWLSGKVSSGAGSAKERFDKVSSRAVSAKERVGTVSSGAVSAKEEVDRVSSGAVSEKERVDCIQALEKNSTEANQGPWQSPKKQSARAILLDRFDQQTRKKSELDSITGTENKASENEQHLTENKETCFAASLQILRGKDEEIGQDLREQQKRNAINERQSSHDLKSNDSPEIDKTPKRKWSKAGLCSPIIDVTGTIAHGCSPSPNQLVIHKKSESKKKLKSNATKSHTLKLGTGDSQNKESLDITRGHESVGNGTYIGSKASSEKLAAGDFQATECLESTKNQGSIEIQPNRNMNSNRGNINIFCGNETSTVRRNQTSYTENDHLVCDFDSVFDNGPEDEQTPLYPKSAWSSETDENVNMDDDTIEDIFENPFCPRPPRAASGGGGGKDAAALKKMYPWRRCRRRRFYRLLIVVVIYVLLVLITMLAKGFQGTGQWGTVRLQTSDREVGVAPGEGSNPNTMEKHGSYSKHVRNRRETDDESNPNETDCAHNENAGGHFPANFLSEEVTKHGGFLIHLMVALYTFGAIAAVCDIYFVPSLEHICEDLALQADVAGATFMAAASSAPEFCTSVIGVFLAKSDVGVGAIVGSSIFNLLFIIGACALFAGMPVALSWYPLTRDSVFYTISIVEMVLVMQDSRVEWQEATIMVSTYLLYVVVMYFNTKIEEKANACAKKVMRKESEDLLSVTSSRRMRMVEARTRSRISTTLLAKHSPGGSATGIKSVQMELSKLGLSPERASDLIHDNAIAAMQEKAEKRRRSSASNLKAEQSSGEAPLAMPELRILETPAESVEVLSASQSGIVGTSVDQRGAKVADTVEIITPLRSLQEVTPIDEYENPLEFPEGCLARFYFILMLPITLIHAFTIPDTRIPGGWQARAYLLSFVLCIAYIVVYSYVMVWMVEIVAVTFSIPTTVAGLTVLAAGTSVPDCLASIFVARDGYGDMAVSNAIGSNVFDILLCLGIPWLIDGLMRGDHGTVIDSAGMIYAVISLLFTIVFLIGSLKVVNWTLTFNYGAVLMVVYIIIITICILIETNVLFSFTKPDCKDKKHDGG